MAPAAGFEPASFSVNSRARSPRVLDRKKWWRQSVTLRPRRSCKDHLHPCAVPVVPRVGFEPTSPRLQRGAFTRLASSAELARTPVIETGSPEWRSGARPSSYARNGGKWTESNLLPAGTAFTARRRHQPVLMALPRFGCGPRGCTGPSRLMRPRGFLTDLPAQRVRRLSTPSLAAGTSAVSRMADA